MSTLNIIEQISQQSTKVLFHYNLEQKKFDLLSEAFKNIWSSDSERIEHEPGYLFQTVVDEDQAVVMRCWHKLQQGDHVEGTVRINQGRRLRFVRYDIYPIRNAEGEIVNLAGMAEDITKHRQFIDYLTEFGQRKNSVLEMVSHDLRGPLAVVKSIANLLRQDMRENRTGEIEHYTDIIERACSTCTNLINDLLSEEHLRSAEIYVNKIRVNLNEQIRNVTENYEVGQIVQQTIELDLPEDPIMMELDPIKFSQILNNLISNSIKFTPPGGSIRMKVYREEEELVLEHSDTGIGIPEELLPRIFEKRSGAGRLGLKGEESRGLGLSIVRELVELHGGSITVRSQEQESTTFTIRLPLHD
jgi:signal transduction histidine kinase